MRLAIAVLFVTTSVARAGGPISERWDAAYLGGQRAGYVRTYVTTRADDPTQLKGTIELRLQIKRMSDTVALGMDVGTYETREGVVTGTFMKQYLGKNLSLEVDGVVDGDKLHLKRDKTKPLDPAPWTDRVVGIAKQQRMFLDRELKPGDEFSYLSFEPSISLVITTRVHVREWENVELFVGAGKKKLLRVELIGDKIQNFQPPPMTIWLDEKNAQIRSDTEVPGLGLMSLVKATKEQAMVAGAAPAQTLEAHRVIPLKQRLQKPHDWATVVYRVKVAGDDDPASGFSSDGRQRAANVKGDTFDLTVQRGIVAQAEKAGQEYLQSSYFINSKDDKVRELARRAVGVEADPWKKALRIEKYVNDIMRPKAHELLATADHVARNLEGDCTEYAMLTAAMCRAELVPSRTAIGLVYGDVRGQPSMVFHMWTEVWVRGQWVGLDATLGRGGIGAAHLKVSDQSWHNESSMTPLLPTLNLLGRVSIDVLRTE